MTEMRWFIYADDVAINVSKLLAMMPTVDNRVTLLFDGGQTLEVSKIAAQSVIIALRTWESSSERTGMTCLPQTM